MSFYIQIPSKQNRISQAWYHTDNYLSNQANKILSNIFIQCDRYSQWSFALAMLGIEGWPVAALWDDFRQTCRDSQN